MLKLKVGRTIDTPAAEAWDLITDTDRWPQWGPSVRAVECPDRHVRKGTEGRIQTSLGLWLTFAITELENERYWSWRVGGIPATGHRIEPLGGHRCRLIFEIPILAAPYAIICYWALKRIGDLLK